MQRAHPRFQVQGRAVYMTQRGIQVEAKPENLSLGGVMVSTRSPGVSSSEVVDLAMDLEGCRMPLILRCRVAWVGAEESEFLARIGLAFLKLPPREAEMISALASRHLS